MEQSTKVCPRCSVEKPLTDFYKDRARGDGVKVYCKPCEKEYESTVRLEANRLYQAAYHLRNIEKKRQYREDHKEQIAAKNKKWYAAHPEYVSEKNATRLAMVRGSEINDLSDAQWEEIKAAFHYRCAYCKKKRLLTMDHVTPVSKDGQHTLMNIVPSCRECNSKKKDRDVLVPVQPLLLTIAEPRKPKKAS